MLAPGPYRRLLLSAGCFYATVGGAYPLLVLQTRELAGPLVQGYVIGLPLFLTVVAAIYWGQLTDRLGARRPTLIATLVVGGLLFLPMAWLEAWPLVALRTAQMGFLAAGYVLYASLASQYYPRSKGASLGYYNLAAGVGWGSGGLAVSLLVPAEGAYGQASPEVIGAVGLMALAALAAALLLVGLGEPAFKPARGSLRQLLRGPHRRLLLVVAVTAFLLMTGYNQLIVFFPDYIVSITGSTPILGLFFATAGILGSLFAGYIGRFTDSHGRRLSLRVALGSYVGVMVLYSAVAHPLLFAPLEAVWPLLPALVIGLAFAIPLWNFFMVAASAMVSDLSPPHQRGRAMGLLQSAFYLGMGVGALTAGHLRTLFDFWVVFALGTLVVATAAGVGFTLPDTRELEPESAAGSADFPGESSA